MTTLNVFIFIPYLFFFFFKYSSTICLQTVEPQKECKTCQLTKSRNMKKKTHFTLFFSFEFFRIFSLALAVINKLHFEEKKT